MRHFLSECTAIDDSILLVLPEASELLDCVQLHRMLFSLPLDGRPNRRQVLLVGLILDCLHRTYGICTANLNHEELKLIFSARLHNRVDVDSRVPSFIVCNSFSFCDKRRKKR